MRATRNQTAKKHAHHIQAFPIEAVSMIARDCTNVDLFSLAVVSKAFRFEAERYLYHTIILTSGRESAPEGRVSMCLQTLIRSSNKAQLLRSFEFRVWRSNAAFTAEQSRLSMPLLYEVLPKLANLKSLSLYISNWGAIPDLQATLAKCTFSLDSFFTERRLGLSGWFMQHHSLRLVGLHGQLLSDSDDLPKQLQYVPALYQPPRQKRQFQLCSFERYNSNVLNRNDNIELYPVFSPVDETGVTTWTADGAREIADRLSQTNILECFSVYLRSMCHTQNLKRVLVSMSTNFDPIPEVELYLEEQELCSDNKAFADILQQVNHLREIRIYFWNQETDRSRFRDRAVQLATEWTVSSPSIVAVWLPDGSGVERDRDGQWRLWGREVDE